MFLKKVLEYLIIATEVAGISVIIFGFAKAMYMFVKNEIKSRMKLDSVDYLHIIRNKLGIYLLLGLEIIIASDIMQTILNPSKENLILLGGIVIIRIAISYFLGKEIKNLKQVQDTSKI